MIKVLDAYVEGRVYVPMVSFQNDYSEIAHPELLQALLRNCFVQEEAYGLDRHSLSAAQRIRDQANAPDADVHFLIGGTQTNLIALSSFLRPYEAIIATDQAHIFVHETGAIEATGHKILTVPTIDGKLSVQGVDQVLQAHTDEHMVKPRLVKISDTTELGTVYTKAELLELRRFCLEKDLLLYLDGARLGSALTAPGNDLTLRDIAAHTDAFYIGGTKNGAMMGEALLITNERLQADFRYCIKQRGGMLAKGAAVGIQFDTLFCDGLYFRLAMHANAMAARLRAGLESHGCRFQVASTSNQLFPILHDQHIQSLQTSFQFYVMQSIDEMHHAIRLVTSWATTEEAVDGFIQAFHDLYQA